MNLREKMNEMLEKLNEISALDEGHEFYNNMRRETILLDLFPTFYEIYSAIERKESTQSVAAEVSIFLCAVIALPASHQDRMKLIEGVQNSLRRHNLFWKSRQDEVLAKSTH